MRQIQLISAYPLPGHILRLVI